MVGLRKLVDWDSVEPLYRAGVLSNYQICEQYRADHAHSQTFKKEITEGGIRYRAKEKGWQKNLASKVQEKIKEKVLRNSLRNAKLSDDEAIEEAAQTGANIVLRHQREILALVDHEEALLQELKDATGKEIPDDLKITLKGKSSILKDLAAIRAQRITMERQANNIDAASSAETLEDLLKKY